MAGKTKPTKKHSSGNNKNNRNRHNSTGSAGSGSAESMASISPSPPAEQAELIEFKEAGEPLGSAPLGNGFVNGIPGLNYVSGRINNVLHTMEKIPGTILSPVHGLLNNSNAEEHNGEAENDEKAGGKVSNGGVIQEVLQIPGNLVNGIVSGNDPENQENEQQQGGGLLGMTLFPFFGILLNVVNISSVQEMFAKEGVHMFVTIAKETGVVMKQQLIAFWQILANLAYNHPILLCLSALIGSTVICPVLVIMTLIFLPFGIAMSTILAPIWLSLCAGGIIILTAMSPVLIFTAMIVFIIRRFRNVWI